MKKASELVTSFNDSVKRGAISKEEAQERVKEILIGPKQPDGKRTINPNIDLGKNGHFYVLDNEGNLLAHPSLEGQNIIDKKTSDGFFYIKDVIGQAKKPEGGFTTYIWPLRARRKKRRKSLTSC